MTYSEAIEFLHGLSLFGANFGLENTLRLAAHAGNPQERLRFIHVAGTNGKGSTCAMLESIYRASGLRVGLFTSPHLVSFRERIQVNRQFISEADVARLAGEMREQLQTLQPTFFEFVTVMALRHFAEQRCDLVIWETGLGGRLDATNIVTPLASVITNIGSDHQQWLGDTLAKIAAEKAGIIKGGVPVVTATTALEALAVIRETARRRAAPLVSVTPADVAAALPAGLALPLPGEHQKLNAAVAGAVVKRLQKQIPVSEAALRRGLETVDWPGRLQIVRRGQQTLLIDGAHNVEGAQTLRAALQSPVLKPKNPHALTLLLGVLHDKDVAGICAVLAPLATRICATAAASGRALEAAELARHCRAANPQAEVVVCHKLAEALARSESDPFVVVTGSLYLVGEALEQLGLLPADVTGERGLNEWQGR